MSEEEGGGRQKAERSDRGRGQRKAQDRGK